MTSQPSFTWRAPKQTGRRIALGAALAVAALMLLAAFGSMTVRSGDAEAAPKPTTTMNKRLSKSRIRDQNIYAVPRPVVTYFYAEHAARCRNILDTDFVTFTWATENTSSISIHADSPYDGYQYDGLKSTSRQTFRVKCDMDRQPFTMTASGPGGTTKATAIVPLQRVA